MRCLGYQQITDLSSAVALTVPTGATHADIQAEAQPVRWRMDGTNPTDSVGTRLLADQSIWAVGELARLRFIEESASAVLNVHYFG